jgi:hypothetical protein
MLIGLALIPVNAQITETTAMHNLVPTGSLTDLVFLLIFFNSVKTIP